jgi:Xaa-Pro aminopeptidase
MDNARAKQLVELFNREGYQALVCRIPEHVLMLAGYLPLLGNTFCVVSLSAAKEPEVRLAVPVEEKDRVPPGAAVEVQTFAEETLSYISNTIAAVREPLAALLHSADVGGNAVVGYEGGYAPIAPAYTQVGVPGPATIDLLREILPGAYLCEATSILDELAAIRTPEEIARIRQSAEVGHQGFIAARDALRVGATEADVAAAATAALLRAGYAVSEAHVVLPQVHVMTGARAALAYRPFNLTSNTRIARGDTVSVQMEIGIDGHWAELTRTFFAGEISDDWKRVHEACMAAQDAALRVIRAGASGRAADEAARSVLREAGYGDAFKHGLGHGVGSQAINHGASPILHPVSDAVLRSGMVHNVEPAVYVEGEGGVRLNDDVVVQDEGNEVLSRMIPREQDWLVVGG